jgi:4-oxalocrotonate tautomerase
MPFIHVKVAGPQLEPGQVKALQQGVTTLMAEILHKQGKLTAVLVEQVPLAGWSVGAESVAQVAQIDAIISAGTNTPEQKARFITEAYGLLRAVLGPDLSEISYVVLHDVPKDSWGYGGLTQAARAQGSAAA